MASRTPASLVTATLTHRQGILLTFSVELVRGSGRYLPRKWHTIAQARRALRAPLPTTITMTLAKKTPQTGRRLAFYAYLVPKRVTRGQTTKLQGYSWQLAIPQNLTTIRADIHARIKSDRPARLVNQLGARSFSRRERAATALMAYGPVVMPSLEKGLEHSVLAVRASCLRLQQGKLIEQQVLRSTIRPGMLAIPTLRRIKAINPPRALRRK